MACTNNIQQGSSLNSANSSVFTNKSTATPTKLIFCSTLPCTFEKRAALRCSVITHGQQTPPNDHFCQKTPSTCKPRRRVVNATPSNTICGPHVRDPPSLLEGVGGITPITSNSPSDVRRINQVDKTLNMTGKFGRFGGIFVPETLITSLNKLSAEFMMIMHDPDFQAELGIMLKDYVGRETPLYFAQRLTDHYKNKDGYGPDIYLKREDLNYGGAHKINNAIGQAMLAKHMGLKHVVTATGSGQHGVATAAACAKLNLDCTVLVGDVDMERHSSNLLLMMEHLGAKVKSVNGTFKDATSEAIRNWVEDLYNSYYLAGIAVGPHPCPTMVREFQSIIGKETRKQAMAKWGGLPDVILACVGSGSNALGIFHEFLSDEDVRLIGVEAAGKGIDSGKHSATLTKGDVGIYHGSICYLLQDEDGQIIVPHSIGVGLEYPAVSPELSFLKDIGRAEFYTT